MGVGLKIGSRTEELKHSAVRRDVVSVETSIWSSVTAGALWTPGAESQTTYRSQTNLSRSSLQTHWRRSRTFVSLLEADRLLQSPSSVPTTTIICKSLVALVLFFV